MDFLKQNLRLRSHLQPVATGGEGLLVLDERGDHLIEGELYEALGGLLDGTRSTPELVRELKGRFAFHEVVEGLVKLNSLQMLSSGLPPGVPALPYWESNGITPSGAAGPVALHVLDPAALETLQQELHTLYIAIAEEGATLDLLLVGDYLDPAVSAFAGSATRPWLPLKPTGVRAWIGPLFVPGRTACYHCLSHRLLRNRPHRTLAGNGAGVPGPSLGSALRAATALSATQVARWLLNPEENRLQDTLLEFDPGRAEMRRHTVVRRPQCPACGSGRLAEPQPPELTSRPVQNFRIETPHQTLERFEHHVSPVTGLVSEIRPLGGGPVNVARARYVQSRLPEDWNTLRRGRYYQAGGKGCEPAEARASALAEALERYCSSWHGLGGHLTASREELGEDALHPNQVMLFSERQYRNAPENSLSIKERVPLPFDDARPREWLRAWSFTHRRWRYVPAGLAYYDLPEPDIVGDSNGNASGTTYEDAVFHGFLELVERDSVALWWYNRVRRPGIRPEEVDPEYIRALREHYKRWDREFWVLDLTSDLGIPAFTAVSCCRGQEKDLPVMGFGAHLDPRRAVLRAVNEMNQALPYFLARAERIDRRVPQAEDSTSSYSLQLEDCPYLLPDGETGLGVPCSLPGTTQELVDFCRRKTQEQGLELIVADLTQPDVEMPVVKVMVPGLRHFWRRLGPGRLYDVPVSLGWLPEPVSEEAVNPIKLDL